MPSQSSLDSTYLKIAKTWAELSKARRKKVGCIIVKDGAIISDGYNGTPSGFDNDCEFEDPFNKKLVTKPEVLHAESNAITISVLGAEMVLEKTSKPELSVPNQ